MKLKSSPISTLNRYKKSLAVIALLALFIVLFFKEKEKVIDFQNKIKQSDYLPHSDCGVVLTGAAGRIREAFEILAQNKIDHLIISGVYKDTQLKEIFPHLPFYTSINPDRIILEKISGSTYGNAVQTLLVVETLKCRKLLLMTSDIHMYRAERMFKAAFPKDFPIETYLILHSAQEKQIYDVYLESFKSLFYNIIIYLTELTGHLT